MGDIIPETGTEVTVNVDSQGLDDIINVIQGDNILSQVLSPAIEQLTKDKETLYNSATNLANAIAERIKSYQEQFIGMNQSIITGNMLDSIEVESLYDSEAEVGATAVSDEGFPYPIIVENGSVPHIIEGNPLLAFDWPKEGVFVITHSVQHPGTMAKPFVAPSLEYIQQDIEELIGSEVTSKLGT